MASDEKVVLPWKFRAYRLGKKTFLDVTDLKMDEKPSSITMLTHIDGSYTKNKVYLKNKFLNTDDEEVVATKPPKKRRGLPPPGKDQPLINDPRFQKKMPRKTRKLTVKRQ